MWSLPFVLKNIGAPGMNFLSETPSGEGGEKIDENRV